MSSTFGGYAKTSVVLVTRRIGTWDSYEAASQTKRISQEAIHRVEILESCFFFLVLSQGFLFMGLWR